MRIAALALMLILTGCISAHYSGNVYAPTQKLTVYYSRADIPKGNYQKIGELKVISDTTCSSESIIQKVREESMARGADIALIHWFDARFILDDKKHSKECRISHCHHEAKDKYKYKKLVKVILIKNKSLCQK